ncbi:MAG: PhzF family phenazine biosynthesis protein [Chitinophagaceae bacterium]|jgi:PhzF family phenazine biosynthesis protein|nr:PhzF family phenazine biosynthesis protein [Chitinophagaceae bacterium]
MTIELPIYQVDAFSSGPFTGNPAAVVPLQKWLDEQTMQQIAMENNLSETAFYTRQTPDQKKRTLADFFIRWFTPKTEIDLCGHATLATAYVCLLRGEWPENSDSISFITEKAGLLTVSRQGDLLMLDLPARIPEPCPEPEGLLEALGIDYPVRILKSRDYFLVLPHQNAVLELTPDFTALQKVDALGVIVSAKGDEDADAVSRCFYPRAGVNEDPVTGSAHCNIIPYWSEHLGRPTLLCKQLSERGGMLQCEYRGDRVIMGGECYLYMQGMVMLPA